MIIYQFSGLIKTAYFTNSLKFTFNPVYPCCVLLLRDCGGTVLKAYPDILSFSPKSPGKRTLSRFPTVVPLSQRLSGQLNTKLLSLIQVRIALNWVNKMLKIWKCIKLFSIKYSAVMFKPNHSFLSFAMKEPLGKTKHVGDE